MQIVNPLSTSMDDKEALKIHIFGTYITLRLGMGALAAFFPLVLFIVGKAHNIDLQGSMSAYYWAGADGVVAARTVFVGGLLAIGSFLYLYKGFTNAENIALNLAAMFASMVAFFPMSWNCSATKLPPVSLSHCPTFWNPHGTCAVALFACLAYVALFRARDTLPILNNKARQRFYLQTYRITGALMLASPLIATVMRVGFGKLDSYTYFVELSGIVAFAIFWIAKSFELRETKFVETSLDMPK